MCALRCYASSWSENYRPHAYTNLHCPKPQPNTPEANMCSTMFGRRCRTTKAGAPRIAGCFVVCGVRFAAGCAFMYCMIIKWRTGGRMATQAATPFFATLWRTSRPGRLLKHSTAGHKHVIHSPLELFVQEALCRGVDEIIRKLLGRLNTWVLDDMRLCNIKLETKSYNISSSALLLFELLWYYWNHYKKQATGANTNISINMQTTNTMSAKITRNKQQCTIQTQPARNSQ